MIILNVDVKRYQDWSLNATYQTRPSNCPIGEFYTIAVNYKHSRNVNVFRCHLYLFFSRELSHVIGVQRMFQQSVRA